MKKLSESFLNKKTSKNLFGCNHRNVTEGTKAFAHRRSSAALTGYMSGKFACQQRFTASRTRLTMKN
jgi:hypothetical protein